MTLFYRHGESFDGNPGTDGNGKPYTMRVTTCYRCGGQGGAEKWRHTGWTCFQCGGSGQGPVKGFKLYTAEQLAKLNATADKRRAKKAAAAEVARAKAEQEANERRAAFMAQRGDLLKRAEQYAARSEFVRDVTRKAIEAAAMTGAQADGLEAAIAKFAASDARKAASGHIGNVGDRIELTVTCERVYSFESQFGICRIASMRDESGNAIVSKGKYVPPTATFDRELERWNVTAESFRIKATVKAHDYYRDERQTIVQRVADLETI